MVAVGNTEELGLWKIENAKRLEWTTGNFWKGTVTKTSRQPVEFKFVVVRGVDPIIQSSGNLINYE